MMRHHGFLGVAAIVVTVCLAPRARAVDEAVTPPDPNAELHQRIDALSSEVDQLKRQQAAQSPAPLEKAPAAKAVDMQFYGIIKLDAAYDDSRSSAGNFARWVESEGQNNDDDQFNMTANQTRLGVLLSTPSQNGIKTTGQVEIDFYGSGAAENKPDAMLRHAFVKADWTNWNASLLAGQTADILSPLNAPTVNYSVNWWQGNIGYRRPQIRLTKGTKLADGVELKLEAGATRSITDRRFVYTGSTDPDSGSDSGVPTAQGRASVSFPSFNGKPGTIGVSGHWGQEDQHVTNALGAIAGHVDLDTWSGNVDVKLPVTDWLLLQAEGFVGENLSAYLGGIGQGVDAAQQETIAAQGGWAAVSLGPWAQWQFNLGAGIDKVDEDDVTASAKTPPRLSNVAYFGNANHALTSNLQLALEIAHMRTTYKEAPEGDNLREQVAVIYKF